MAIAPIGRRHTAKPLAGARIDLTHAQSRGLVGQWMFDGNKAGCDNLVDSTRNACTYTGTMRRYYSHTRGGGRGIETDGSATYATIARSSDIETASFTVVAWIDLSRVSGVDQATIRKHSGTYPNISGWVILFQNSDGTIYFQFGNGSSWPRANFGIAQKPNGVCCIACYRDATSTNCGIAINGSIASSSTGQLFAASASANLDVGHLAGGTLMRTAITQLRYYNRALSASEIAAVNADPWGNLDQSSNRRTLVLDGLQSSQVAQNLLLLGVG